MGRGTQKRSLCDILFSRAISFRMVLAKSGLEALSDSPDSLCRWTCLQTDGDHTAFRSSAAGLLVVLQAESHAWADAMVALDRREDSFFRALRGECRDHYACLTIGRSVTFERAVFIYGAGGECHLLLRGISREGRVAGGTSHFG